MKSHGGISICLSYILIIVECSDRTQHMNTPLLMKTIRKERLSVEMELCRRVKANELVFLMRLERIIQCV